MSSKTLRRIGVITNFLTLILLLTVIYYDEKGGWVTEYFSELVWSCLGVICITFYLVLIRTGLYRLTSAKIKELDEREVLIINKSLRYSYFALPVFIINSIFFVDFDFHIQGHLHGFMEIEALFVFTYLYIIIILPASIIAWKERT